MNTVEPTRRRLVCPRSGEVDACWECGYEVPHRVEMLVDDDVAVRPRCQRHELALRPAEPEARADDSAC